jgi:hypothetical protein
LDITNSGTITASGGNLTIQPANDTIGFFNSGTLRADTGTLVLSPALYTNTGKIESLANSRIDINGTINGGTLLSNGLTNINAASTIAAISGAGTVNIAAGISLVSDGTTLSTLIINGTQVIRPNGNSTSKLSSLTLATDTANAYTATLDLTNNSLILQSDSSNKPATIALLAKEILSGNNNGTWTGNGITSSTNAADTTHNSTLILIDNADLHLTSFAGQSVDDNSLLITRALLGDADLSGTVDLLDFSIWFSHLGNHTYSYTSADLNNDGTVDLLDFNVWFAHLGNSGLNLTPNSPNNSPVPEPATLGVWLAAMVPLALRRRRAAF